MTWSEFESWLDNVRRRPLIMGVLNVTPDSFSDGGRYASSDRAAEHAMRLAQEGADLIDIGGESTRPGSARTPLQEQIGRIAPVLDRLRTRLETVISIDTTQAAVAQAALDRGAAIINDISAGCDDPGMFTLAAQRGSGMILMHKQGEPATMQNHPAYSDVVAEIGDFLMQRLQAACAAGIPARRLLVDPGIGFGKTLEHNLTILRRLNEFRRLGRPVVLGTSRKGFIGRITGETEPSGRLMGSLASAAWGLLHGADIVRVHDVSEMAKVVRMIEAIRGDSASS